MGSIRHVLNRWSNEAHLRGLPEMQLFASDAQRDQAVREIHGTIYTWKIVPVLVLHAVVLCSVFFGLAWVVKTLFPGLIVYSGHISIAIVLMGYLVFLVVALRWSTVRDLRRKLIEVGVPVCLHCGYDLRGAAHQKCPECGRDVKDAIAASQDDALRTDSGQAHRSPSD